jgi:hypothetical protein
MLRSVSVTIDRLVVDRPLTARQRERLGAEIARSLGVLLTAGSDALSTRRGPNAAAPDLPADVARTVHRHILATATHIGPGHAAGTRGR